MSVSLCKISPFSNGTKKVSREAMRTSIRLSTTAQSMSVMYMVLTHMLC